MKKRTTFMSNVDAVMREFDCQFCAGTHTHQRIEGCEGGKKRSQWAARYPDMLCEKITEAVKEQLEQDGVK